MSDQHDRIQPDQLLNFEELVLFQRRWDELGLSDENDLAMLQESIMRDPRQGKLVAGTHGLRKMRYAPPSWNVGKSGALRVLYVYFNTFGAVVLALVYAKNEQDNISASGKKAINRLIDDAEAGLRERYRRT